MMTLFADDSGRAFQAASMAYDAALMAFNVEEVRLQGAHELLRPSYLYRPRLFLDGHQWCALLGENVQDGVVGYGASPDEAYRAFDKAWYEKIPEPASTPHCSDAPDGVHYYYDGGTNRMTSRCIYCGKQGDETEGGAA